MPKVNKWIQKVKPKKGALSRQLGIPEKENIPNTLLSKIVKAKAGEKIKNPTQVGKKNIKVTRLLERRAIFAQRLKSFKK